MYVIFLPPCALQTKRYRLSLKKKLNPNNISYHFQTTYKKKPDENGSVVFEFPELVTKKITVKIIKKKKNIEVTIVDFTVKACLPGKKSYIHLTFVLCFNISESERVSF